MLRISKMWMLLSAAFLFLTACSQEATIADLEGIEEIYDLAFEPIRTPERTFEEFAVLEMDGVEEIMNEQMIEEYRFVIYTKKNQPEGYEHVFFTGFLMKGTDSPIYEIGELGYGPYVESLSPYSADKVVLFNREYLKLGGICGANCPRTYYIDMDHGNEPSLFLAMDAGGLEKDINGDGVLDLVATAGTTIDTTIYLEENGQIVKVELSAIPDTVQVYHTEGNAFRIFFENGHLASYHYRNGQLHFSELIE